MFTQKKPTPWAIVVICSLALTLIWTAPALGQSRADIPPLCSLAPLLDAKTGRGAFLSPVVLGLCLEQTRIRSTSANQFVVGAAFDDSAVLQHKDAVSHPDG